MKNEVLSLYTKKEDAIAKYAKALAHPARVAIINLLLKKQSWAMIDLS